MLRGALPGPGRSRVQDQPVLQRLGFPSVGPHRRFVTAVAIDAVGSGVFMPVSVLYFLMTTDLSLVQVGGVLSLASLLALPVGPLLGGVVDRLGAKQVLLAGNLLQAVGFAAYLVTDSFAGLTFWTVVVTVGRTAFWGSYGTIVAAISRPGERETWFGFLGALRNVGFAVGGLVAGAAITVGTQAAYASIVVVNAVSYVVALVLLLAVPATARTGHRPAAGSWATVLRDRPYWLLWTVQLGYCFSMMVLNVAMPVYATTVLGLSGWVTGAVFTLNTVMVGLGQGLVVRAMTGVRRWRVLVLANLVFAASFVVLLGASRVGVAVGVAVVLLGTAVYTAGELLGGPVLGALGAEAAPEHLRGRYLSLVQLAWNLAGTVAPVSFAWLLDRGAAPVWLVLTGVSLVGALLAVRLGRVLPVAAEQVTNRVDPLPV
ncbi:MFS transporter [Nocardioides sp. zg-579]|uniref:MFS transporter n=1 Tax=Nocardioides marmotae TaxID=2663857 RepID=A0A6I3JBZ7_9ACTN|nr:MFS transporter [Gordonia jinghuaiqii]MTB95569.1 MFS transporter [Nocardioides marmotae]QKE03430.1 MFS transporter [Nocardioides marmotae]